MRRVLLSNLLFILTTIVYAQFSDSTTGLLRMPTADMEKSGTFMITNNYLNGHNLYPTYWATYNTFAYGFDITFFSRVEIAYVCTIIDSKRKDNPDWTDKIRFNQDRHFSAKIQLLKEGELFTWMPALAVGVCDPISATLVGYRYAINEEVGGSGMFNRVYIVATKHFKTKIGEIGAHLGYQYNRRDILNYNSPAFAVDWKPIWITQMNSYLISGLDIVAEYDGRTFDIGCILSLWKNHFEVMLQCNALKYFEAGVRYKVVLKS